MIITFVGCNRGPSTSAPDSGSVDGGTVDGSAVDAPTDSSVGEDAATDPDAAPPAGVVLYDEGARHSPITSALAARLQTISSAGILVDDVFAKVGDSITASPDFLTCFDGGAIDLGTHAQQSATIAHYLAGDVAGVSPYDRTSVAAVGGTTARDVMNGAPCPLERELDATQGHVAVVMFGTNEVRYGKSLDEFGEYLWNAIDEVLGRGVIPVMSTIPPMNNYPAADARIPTFNRVIRAIAQGRGVPLVDLHRELVALPNRGLSSDQLHPSTAPAGACVLNAQGLTYGYNVRNLITIEALSRVRAALAGSASDAVASVRQGAGTSGDPFIGTLPLVDLGDTRQGNAVLTSSACGGPLHSGREVVYRVDLPSVATIDAYVVDRGAVDVDVQIFAGTPTGQACVTSGDATATASVGPGTVFVVVDTRDGALEGEFALVVSAR